MTADAMPEDELAACRREQRERASSAFQARFDVPDTPRPISARQALHTGNWQGFFYSCCAPAAAPFLLEETACTATPAAPRFAGSN